MWRECCLFWVPCLFGDGGHYLEGELDNNIAVQLDAGGVLAKFFDGSDVDELALNLDACGSESFGELDGVHRAVDYTGLAGVGGDDEVLKSLDLGGDSLGCGFDLSKLVGLLTLVLGQDLEGRRSGDNSLSGGDKVVAAVAGLYFNDVVLVSKALYVFYQNKFHCCISVFRGLFHKVGYIGQECQMAGAFNGLSHTTLELERSSGDATGQDFTLFVEELFKELGILVIDVLDTAAFETAVFFLFHVH